MAPERQPDKVRKRTRDALQKLPWRSTRIAKPHNDAWLGRLTRHVQLTGPTDGVLERVLACVSVHGDNTEALIATAHSVVLSSTAFTELCETLADSEEIGFDFAVHFVYWHYLLALWEADGRIPQEDHFHPCQCPVNNSRCSVFDRNRDLVEAVAAELMRRKAWAMDLPNV